MPLFDIATFNTFSETDHQISQTFIRICISYQMINVYQLFELIQFRKHHIPDSVVHGADMGPIWGRQDPGGPYVGPMNFAIWNAKWQ